MDGEGKLIDGAKQQPYIPLFSIFNKREPFSSDVDIFDGLEEFDEC